ncbi:Myb-like_DNA-binding domain-containing protein [Hexamita inflata]|uniref:Myb-like DNA-binding domain-containing protein n=1 Tax=Hexamita inflata TaxID=28002 RepID=A0AA86QH29_9EUKA|nr:Myb-like DNA-binding domain-containing protein [Hexamita inflata]CAI9953008.1 Myb-like DNA-binding domain-containing protein [Hexamita inflata]
MESAKVYASGNYMRSDVKCKAWTQSQIDVLLEAVSHLGSDWRAISQRYFPERNPNQLKCKYNYIMRTQGDKKKAPVAAPQVSLSHDSITTSQLQSSWTSSFQNELSFDQELMPFDFEMFE